jgi:antitoxin HicB
MNKNKHRGTDLRDFLEEEGILEEVETRALKRAIAMQLGKLINQKSLSKADMALRMKTSRAAVDRMLDGSNPSMTLATLERAARALGQRIKLELIPETPRCDAGSH